MIARRLVFAALGLFIAACGLDVVGFAADPPPRVSQPCVFDGDASSFDDTPPCTFAP